MSPEIVGTGGDQALKVTIDATSTKDFEVALLAATAAVGMEKRFGAPFSNSEIEFKTPEGSATFIVPLLEAEALRGDDGKLSAPAFVAFSFAADYREIRHLAWQEEKFPTLKTAPQELERVIDAYLNQKANGQAVAKITISP
jgi:hypothetical protein